MVNWACTWANQTSGSVGQKGGNFSVTAVTAETGGEAGLSSVMKSSGSPM